MKIERNSDAPEVTGDKGMTNDTMKGSEFFVELFNFSCVLRGKAQYLEQIKEHIITEYVNKGRITLAKPTYNKRALYILTEPQWREYQKLKEKRTYKVGGGWP